MVKGKPPIFLTKSLCAQRHRKRQREKAWAARHGSPILQELKRKESDEAKGQELPTNEVQQSGNESVPEIGLPSYEELGAEAILNLQLSSTEPPAYEEREGEGRLSKGLRVDEADEKGMNHYLRERHPTSILRDTLTLIPNTVPNRIYEVERSYELHAESRYKAACARTKWWKGIWRS